MSENGKIIFTVSINKQEHKLGQTKLCMYTVKTTYSSLRLFFASDASSPISAFLLSANTSSLLTSASG